MLTKLVFHMKKRSSILIILISILIAIPLVYVGASTNSFLFESIDFLRNDISSDEKIKLNSVISKFDVEGSINIKNESDIFKIRDNLIFYIWNQPPSVIFPTDNSSKTLPTHFEKNITDTRFENLENLKKIDKLSIEMKHGVNSIVYIFHSEQNNNQLIIYHQGHSGGFINGKHIINYFLKNGYSVMAFSMPLLGMNNQPTINIENIGPIKFFEHDQFKLLESENFSPLNYFFSPINHSLNYLDVNYNFKNYYMVGISGGGWTGTVYPALDTRISKSFAVSGSLPIPLRVAPQDIGDYEQLVPDFYSIANYLELYVMSSYGHNREFIQVFNKFDPCCFSGTLFENYENELYDKMFTLNSGSFEIILDETHNKHEISEFALDSILERIQT